MIPNSIRGAIVGLSASAPSHCFAVYITIGSPSLGIATALSRVFAKVCGCVRINRCSIADYLVKYI